MTAVDGTVVLTATSAALGLGIHPDGDAGSIVLKRRRLSHESACSAVVVAAAVEADVDAFILDARAHAHAVEDGSAFWRQNGDLVLAVGDYFFKVHRAKMCNSEAFRGMLAFPPPPGAETLSGVPVVRLHDDDPRDWLITLKWLYNTAYVVCDFFSSTLRLISPLFGSTAAPSAPSSRSAPSPASSGYRQSTSSPICSSGRPSRCNPAGRPTSPS
jgi:hypothetical protein